MLHISDRFDLDDAKRSAVRVLVAKTDSILPNHEEDPVVRNQVYTELIQSLDIEARTKGHLLRLDFSAEDANEHASRHWLVILATLAKLNSLEARATHDCRLAPNHQVASKPLDPSTPKLTVMYHNLCGLIMKCEGTKMSVLSQDYGCLLRALDPT